MYIFNAFFGSDIPKPKRTYPCYTLKSSISLDSTDYILNVILNNKTLNIYIYISCKDNTYYVETMNEGSHVFNSQSSSYNMISNISNVYIYCSKDILCSGVCIISQNYNSSVDSREIVDIELSS
jgi:hypothetical protein